MSDFNFNILLNKRYFILYLFLIFIVYNLFKYKFGFDSLTNILFVLIVISYVLYTHQDILASRFYKKFLINDGKKFIHNLIGDNNISDDLATLLYKAKILYPFDRKNYIDSLKYANHITQLKIKINKCSSDKQLKSNLEDECQKLLNTFSSINYSLPEFDKNYKKFIKELQNIMYNYCNTEKILPNDNKYEGIEQTFNYYLV